MVLRMQLGPVSGDLLDIVVDRIDQWPRMAERAAPITPQRVVASRPYGPITCEVLANVALIAVVETEGSHARSVALREYRTWVDSRYWNGYAPPEDDIITATAPKCGTTWMLPFDLSTCAGVI